MTDTVEPFHLAIEAAALDELKPRLQRTRWPERETVTDWRQGVPLAAMQALCSYWLHDYDWRKCERKLNAVGQFRTAIDGLGIDFLHKRSPYPDALPLILTHGRPGSVVEFLRSLARLATRRPMAAIRPMLSTWSSRRCRGSAFLASPLQPAGASNASPPPGPA